MEEKERDERFAIDETAQLRIADILKEDSDEKEDQANINSPISAELLNALLITDEREKLKELVSDNSAVTISEALKELSNNEIILFYSIISIDFDKLGEIFSYLSIEQRTSLIDSLNKKTLISVISNVPNDELADFLEDVTKIKRDKVLSLLSNKRRALVTQLSKYDEDTVGSIMTTEYLSVLSNTSIKDIFKKIKDIGNTLETVRTVFIVDPLNKLLGTMRLEEMMFIDEDKKIDEVMSKDFAYISPIANKEEAIPLCEEYDLPVLPVVNKTGEIVGILTFDDVMDVLEESQTEDTLKQGAVAPTSTPYMESKVFNIARSYFIWLLVLLVLNTFTGVIISRFNAALYTLPILVSFIPALNDSCGNSGSQTSTMVIRALTTDGVTKKDYLKIISKEAAVGLLTGLIVALFNLGWVMLELNFLLGVTDVMKVTLINDILTPLGLSNIQIGYLLIASIVSLALFLAIFLSKVLAAVLPIVAKSIKIDPAVMSGPLVASIMDIFTLLLYFGIALLVIDSINPGLLVLG